MPVLVTGSAGFIGYHVAEALLGRGEEVVGLDNLSPYYDVNLKRARLARLEAHPGFRFFEIDISDTDGLRRSLAGIETPRVVHLAAQAGVRHSLKQPFDYLRSNLAGHLVVLEYCRGHAGFEHLVFASSSSVYGGNDKLPFSENDRVDTPASLYAATKKADELMSYAYASLYGLTQTGLRFFTVYGPWGRPDMALWRFTEAILAGRPLQVFNHGDMRRDFTYIDDIVHGVIAALDQAPPATLAPPYRLYNIGNNQAEPLLRMIEVLEAALGRRAQKELVAMQPGDVKETYADITAIQRDLGFCPGTTIDEGVPRFVAWYREYHGL